tara:strand:+ start:464 stop:937 length:474 start_codon:yes stop_codon:yes gene_type:complete
MVTQRIANPFIPVRFWAWPPLNKNLMNNEILKIALNTKNLSIISNHTHYTKLKNRVCGDEIEIYMVIKKGKISNFKYTGESCVYCQASASLLSRTIINKSKNKIKFLLKTSENKLKNIKNISEKEWKSFLKIMNKNNINRKDCLLLPIKATLKALKK